MNGSPRLIALAALAALPPSSGACARPPAGGAARGGESAAAEALPQSASAAPQGEAPAPWLGPPPGVLRVEHEWQRVADPDGVFFTRDQAAPRGFAGIPASRPGRTFPGVAFAEVRAYAFGLARRYLSAGGVFDESVLVTPSGTLGPDVAATESAAALSSEQVARLMAVAARPTAFTDAGVGRYVTRCDFDPHLGFVFFDEGRRPVAQIEVCFECGEWLERPGAALRAPAGMWPEERALFRSLCRELDLGGCEIGTDADDRDAQAWARWRASPALLAESRRAALERDPGVPGDRPLSGATPAERRRLCGWYARAAAEGLFPDAAAPFNPVRDAQYTCTTGRTIDRQSAGTCLADFPACATPVSTALQCLRERLADPCGARSPGCAAGACTFGAREREAR